VKEVAQRVKEEGNILGAIKLRKDDWICPIGPRNCPSKTHFKAKIDGTTEGTGRRGRRRK
jgi:hypothetical protein